MTHEKFLEMLQNIKPLRDDHLRVLLFEATTELDNRTRKKLKALLKEMPKDQHEA